MSALVYVVDDEKIIATTLAAILLQSGFEAKAFVSPIQALNAARECQPQIVLSDVGMPEMTGLELGVQLRLLCPATRIILFSGQANTADLLDEARKTGHEFQILAKPIHPKDLLAVLKQPKE